MSFGRRPPGINNHVQYHRTPKPQPEPVWMIEGQSVTAKQICERLGITASTWENRRRTALKKLAPHEPLTWAALGEKK